MKILKVVHQYGPPWGGGTEIYVRNLARQLAARGHTVHLFVCVPGTGALQQTALDGVIVHRLPIGSAGESQQFLALFYAPAIRRAFQQVLQQVQPDVVHFHHLLGLPAALYWDARAYGAAIAITLHDYWFVCPNTKLLTNDSEQLCAGPRAGLNCARCGFAKLQKGWAMPLAPLAAPVFVARNSLLRRLLRDADVLIAPSRFMRETYARLNSSPLPLLHIPTGIELPPAAMLMSPPITAASFRVAYVGGLAPLKGVHVLVEAFNQMPPEAELTIAGDLRRAPEYARDLHRRARHPGIRFVGALPHAQIWEYLASADVVVVPSLWYENSPLVVQEAFAMRKPVVASRLGALAELVRDEVDGLLTPPGDAPALYRALCRLITERELGRRLQRQAPVVRGIEQLADDMENVYQHLRERPRTYRNEGG